VLKGIEGMTTMQSFTLMIKMVVKLFQTWYSNAGGITMLKDLLTVTEATERFGLSGGFLRRLLRQRRIEGRMMGNSWVIVSSSLEAHLKSERKKGRPLS